jgi:hypothetical protein
MAATNNQGRPASPEDLHQATSPLSNTSSPHSQHSSLQHSPFQASPNPLTDWALQQQQHQHQQAVAAAAAAAQQQQHQQQLPPADLSHFIQDPALMGFNTFSTGFQPTSLDYLPSTTQAALQASLLESTFGTMPSLEETTQAMQWGGAGMENWQEFQSTLQMDGLPRLDSVGSNSPTGTYLEVLSLPSSTGEGWAMVDWGQHGLDQFQHAQAQTAAIFNPSQTLHLRTSSDSSDGGNSLEFGSFEEITPFPYSPFSPDSDGYGENGNSNNNNYNNNNNNNGASSNSHNHRNCYTGESHHHDTVSPAAAVAPMPIKSEPATRHSPGSGAGSTSPASTTVSASSRRNSGPRKSPIAKSALP